MHQCQYSPFGRLAIMCFHDSDQAAVEFLGIGRMQELVGPVRIGMRTEHPGDEKLRLGEALAQHGHERNRPTEAEITRLLRKELPRTGIRSLGQPWGQWR